jgi:AmmeMemoRadiSam system protein B
MSQLSYRVRPPACIGVYSADPTRLKQQLEQLFVAPGGPGLPAPDAARPPGQRLRAILAPHMDYTRGGTVYGWAFKELIQSTDARLFFIIATSHYSLQRFTLTRQDFATPLGPVLTDRACVDRLCELYGPGLFNDPHAHTREHSIELEVVLLQYLTYQRQPVRILPLLVGSLADCVDQRRDPAEQPDLARMVRALRQLEAEVGEPVCYLISGDLAHIGRKFGDRYRLDAPRLHASRQQDEQILAAAEQADPREYFARIAQEDDCRRICGLPPTWVALSAAQPKVGRLLQYRQYVAPDKSESVSFAAMSFWD